MTNAELARRAAEAAKQLSMSYVAYACDSGDTSEQVMKFPAAGIEAAIRNAYAETVERRDELEALAEATKRYFNHFATRCDCQWEGTERETECHRCEVTDRLAALNETKPGKPEPGGDAR